MKLCPVCGQSVAEEISTCPACGGRIAEGRTHIDDYRIVDVLHEGHSSFLCRAVRERTHEPVMIRLFTPRSGVNEQVAARLQRELEELRLLPEEGFVRHHAIRRSADGLWYRISEWIEAENWGSLLASGRLADRRLLLDLFHQMARTLSILHEHGHFIPHLILNDIMALPDGCGGLAVKIDYKLSRFIDPKLDRPAPMLKQLLACHPDIVNRRPLDFRSDIWSLGKVFVELLAGDLEVDQPEGRVDALDLPEELAVLLRVMLADDPDLRPQSMAEIAASLARIRAKQELTVETPSAEGAPASHGRQVRRLQSRIRALAAVVSVLVIAGLAAWFYLDRPRRDAEGLLEGYANRYARSVGFVLVDYAVEAEGQSVYRNVAEGTAFLVDREGYLLTSRHVVCPWLEDPRFEGAVNYLRMRGMEPRLTYHIYLWFEGARAFNPSGRLIEGADLADVYFTENAFSTEASPRVEIAGVARPPMRTRQLVTSPLKDDFAVIKIERVPEGLMPLPLDLDMDPRRLPKLSRVITLGFPLGSRTQVDTVNASVVRGNVRRAFENMFQIDASLHGGNSGGPVIDARGKVIGIVSAVAMDFTQGLVPMVTPVWDMGLILPITDAVKLLVDLKAGQAKWSGVLDFSIEAALVKIRAAASQSRWGDAMAIADEKLVRNLQPGLVTAAGMMRFCQGDAAGARRRFTQALALDPEDYQARWMMVLTDWLTGNQEGRLYRRELAEADWKSPGEFYGFLLNVLEGRLGSDSALDGWMSAAEKSWLYTVCGLLMLRQNDLVEAQRLLEQAVLAADPEGWEFFIARSQLERIRREQRSALVDPGRLAEHADKSAAFDRAALKGWQTRQERREETAPLLAKLASGELSRDDKRETLARLLELDPENRLLLGMLSFAAAAAGAFPEALERIRGFLGAGSRPNALRMSLGLLEAGVLRHMGRQEEASACLLAFNRRTRDPWFAAVGGYLLGEAAEEELRRQAGEIPEHVITGFAAAGFWAEGAKEPKTAMRFYRDALGSFLDDWVEYDFVRERIKQMRRPAG
ncbi:MAG: trypsin-like peptidase domain-containing protein [Desulfobacterales bacterium]|jgi:S1-C subfamily serine protease|nr:trypsin-like peptidase domain-containing protein [Desulfobacterales bacterium]